MWTFEYRTGYYIHGYIDKPECQAQYSPSGHGCEWLKHCKSLHAAKIAITKHIKGSNNV